MTKKGKSKSHRKRSGAHSNNPSLSTVVFTGKIDSSFKNEAKVNLELLKWVSSCTSNSSGVINAVIPVNPSNSENWTNFTNLYDEYRVLLVRAHFVPGCSALSTPTGELMMTVDHDSAVALSSYAGGFQSTSAVIGPLDRKLVREFRMSGTNENQLRNTASPNDVGSIKTFATGVTASTTYGQFMIEYLVQGRGTSR